MLCESCRKKEVKFIREIVADKRSTNIFLCEPCEKEYNNNQEPVTASIA